MKLKLNANVTPMPLTEAVELAYKAFKREAPNGPLNVCTGCCMAPELEWEMRTLPLRKLAAHHFYEYGDGAMGTLDQPPEETRYFMPRLFELMAGGAYLRHSTELTLDRVGRCPEGSFSAAQREAMNAFMLSYFAATLVETRSYEEARGWCDEPLTNLLMAHIGGFDLQPLLDYWLRCEEPMATIRYVRSVCRDFWQEGEISNAFADDRPTFKAQMKQWLTAPAHRAVFAQRLLREDLQALAQKQKDFGRTPFHYMVDTVFDQLTL